MLNENQIRQAINTNEIGINYYFKKRGTQIEVVDKTFDDYGGDLLDSNRLKITLGPIIKVINKRVKKKNRFKNRKDCFDLSTNNNEYILAPGETVIILTNENVSLDGKHAVLIMPRVSLSEVGIILTPAYIDSYYQGILRLNVQNNSKYPFKLSTLEVIAQCFFFDFNGDIVPQLRQQAFARKSVFFSQNWKNIYESDADPFPTKKKQVLTNPVKDFFTSCFKYIYNFFNDNAVVASAVALITGALIFYNTASNYVKKVDKINDNFISNSSEIEIQPDANYGETSVIINCRKDEVIGVLCNNNNVNYNITSYGQDNVEIIFSYQIEQTSKTKQRIDFTYTVIKKID